MQSLDTLNEQITQCTLCPRLTEYREAVAREKVRRYRGQEYWGKPVPGFGDPEATVFILGLAPAAHGANRTGRMFTGDSSGDWLYQALYDNGFASQPDSIGRNDGLKLKGAFISALIRCVPPQNKPLKEEILQCRPYLNSELNLLKHTRVIITLGRMAFDNYCQMMDIKGLNFAHGIIHKRNNEPDIICSYHPSRQNTNTGRLKWEAWNHIFVSANNLLNAT